MRFANAFSAVGMTGATWAHEADTAWASAAVTRLAGDSSGAGYGSRVVAYLKGDSTHYRYYVTFAERAGSAPLAADTTNDATRRRIGMCSEIARIAAVHGSPSREPAGDEDLELWSRHR